MKPTILPLVLILTMLLCQCITPINPDTRTLPRSLVVDGLVTDQPGRNRISLSVTADYTATSLTYVIERAEVLVTDNTGQRIPFLETSPGYYQPDTNWRGIPGRSYTLNIRLSDGREYTSQPELLQPVPPIDSLFVEYTEKPIPNTNAFDKGFDVYLDLKDPATPDNFYRWSWVHYERLAYCGTVKIPECPNCQNYVEYSLSCCGQCWDIVRYQNQINIASDQFINGNLLSRRPILRAPFSSYLPYYVEIEQQSLTKEAYQYLIALNDLIQNTGGLFDAAPVTLIGNMSRIGHPNELVLGYFGASAMVVRPLIIDRQTAPSFPTLVISPPPLPPPGACTSCVESPFRTQKKPRWWPE
ncbi:DUF4249 domain-containing protein [Larkinella sp. VNQ87]|uniref:DUF4249 domain-containing protein n=1 Tax=Larkinella sp. VNQ87 TaxID=3400921 RepID=UPI003C038569